jgi:ribosomal protein L37E
MGEGFLLEKGDSLLSSETWVSGKPVKSYLSGLNLKGTVMYDVTTFRCSACGYLESYALTRLPR